jgi:hypothetical protein
VSCAVCLRLLPQRAFCCFSNVSWSAVHCQPRHWLQAIPVLSACRLLRDIDLRSECSADLEMCSESHKAICRAANA